MTSHDVRKMHVCSQCGKVGIYKPSQPDIEVPLLICTNSLRAPGRVADYQHPRCYEKKMGRAKLLAVSLRELAEIRMCDVSVRTMVAILDLEHP